MRLTGFILIAGIVGAVLCAGGPGTVTKRDRFNNESINTTLWRKGRLGGVNVREQDDRLRISANGLTGTRSFAYLETRHWGANWQQDFVVTVDYRLILPPPSGTRVAAVGFAFSFEGIPFSGDLTGLTVGVQRESTGFWLVWYLYDNGQVVAHNRKPISQTQGQIRVEWDRSGDALKLFAGGQMLTLDSLYQQLGPLYGQWPLVIAIGGLTANGNIQFGGTQAWLDNFEFTGATRPR